MVDLKWIIKHFDSCLVVEDRGGDTGWQHVHQDRKPQPVCASVHQPARSD